MSLSDFLVILGMFAAGVIAALGAVWFELRSIRFRLHALEGVGTLAEEVLEKYKLIRREDRDPLLDDRLEQLKKNRP